MCLKQPLCDYELGSPGLFRFRLVGLLPTLTLVLTDTWKTLHVAVVGTCSVCRSLALLTTAGECLVCLSCDFSCQLLSWLWEVNDTRFMTLKSRGQQALRGLQLEFGDYSKDTLRYQVHSSLG